MKLDLAKYAGMGICVAVSGGKDSMALLHYLYTHAAEHNISVSAVNCDHRIRGEASLKDSAFVVDWCREHDIPLRSFVWDGYDKNLNSIENRAREWRRECYSKAKFELGADAVATAHHMNDNAETVLFNLARGSALSGLTGICDDVKNGIIRPLISVTREEIDEYIEINNIPYVTDETNFSCEYTRNKIRHSVLHALEEAVPASVKAIYRFSRIAAEDEEYFNRLIEERNIIKPVNFGFKISEINERAIFKRAAVKILLSYNAKDYTSDHIEKLFGLQFAESGKKFEFLGFTAFREEGGVAICKIPEKPDGEVDFYGYMRSSSEFCGQALSFSECEPNGKVCGNYKILRFDLNKVPQTAVIRTAREGDKFKKFGGGTKKLGDYFTDKKIPLRIRQFIPLIADGNKILAICGVEISEDIKIESATQKTAYILCTDFTENDK